MEPAAQDVAVERLAQRGGLERTDEWVLAPGALVVAMVEPGREATARTLGFRDQIFDALLLSGSAFGVHGRKELFQ